MSDEIVSGTPAAATPAATPSPAVATPAAPAQAVATPQATPQAPATSGAPGEGWVPSYRVRETREAAIREANQQFAQREAEIRAEGERYKQQLHAIVGVQAPKDPEQDAIKQQFYQLFPKLKQLEEQADELAELRGKAGDFESQQSHYWRQYGEQTMDRVFSKVSDSLGAPLTDEGKKALHASFVGFVQSSPELQSRYSNDPSIVEDFVRAFTSNFIDPARRVASATVIGRTGTQLPQDGPSGAVHVTPTPEPRSLDERAAAGWAAYKHNQK